MPRIDLDTRTLLLSYIDEIEDSIKEEEAYVPKVENRVGWMKEFVENLEITIDRVSS